MPSDPGNAPPPNWEVGMSTFPIFDGLSSSARQVANNYMIRI